MDNAEPPVFFGDRLGLAWAIGAPIRNEEAAQKAVQEVIKELRKDGAIIWSGQGRAGVRASYALALEYTHTWKAIGSGRKIAWQKVDRGELPAGMTGKDAAALKRRPQTPEISPPKTEEFSEPQTPEISPERLRKSLPPTSSDFNSNFNQLLQPTSPSRTREPSRARDSRDSLDGNLSFEEERSKQLRALEELQKQFDQQKEAS
jgi:hypothetical protein